MRKVISSILVLLLLLTAAPVYATSAPAIKVKLDGRLLNLDVPPIIESNKTLVPLRAIFEALDIELQWDGNKRQIIATKEDTTMELVIDRPYAVVNGKEVSLDVPARIISNKTLVPVRFIAESTGSKVDWDTTTRTVIIYSLAQQVDNPSSNSENQKEEGSTNNTNMTYTVGNPNLERGVILYKDWIYFTYREKLYRMREDGSNKNIIYEGISNNFIIVDDWIYFKGGTGINGLYKMKVDGSEKTLIMEGWIVNINVVGDWIYWTDHKSKIVKVKLDGSESNIILDNTPVTNISVVGDWIYYTTNDPLIFDTQFVIYKIKTDGTNNTQLSGRLSFDMSVHDNFIYYSNRLDDSIYRMDTDGQNVEKIFESSEYIRNMEVINDWVYYNTNAQLLDEDGKRVDTTSLYKVKTDGTMHQLVYSGRMSINFNLIEDHIYYSYLNMYRIKDDGTNLEMYHSPN